MLLTHLGEFSFRDNIPHCVRAGKEDQGENQCVEKPLHWVVVMAKVDRLGPNGEFYNNRFNDGKCDPLGRLWAGRSLSLWLKSFLVNLFSVLKFFWSTKVQESLFG